MVVCGIRTREVIVEFPVVRKVQAATLELNEARKEAGHYEKF